MKKFSVNRKNPNPPWPSEQPIVVIPPDLTAAAIGMPDEKVREMPELDLPEIEEKRKTQSYNDGAEPLEYEERSCGIMGYQNNSNKGTLQTALNCQTRFESMNGYLKGHIGDYVKIEFLFGEQTHMEKMGILREIGRDFVVICEAGTENDIVCRMNKIKFITVYGTA